MALGSGGVVASGFGGNPSSGGTGNALTTGGSGGNSPQTSQLDGFRVELPCIPVFYEPQSCETLPEVASQQHVLKFGGNPGTVYEVTLRVRGLVEPSSYPGGVVDGSFVVGGAPVPESHVLTLQLGVAAPKQDYFFNNHACDGRIRTRAYSYPDACPRRRRQSHCGARPGRSSNRGRNGQESACPTAVGERCTGRKSGQRRGSRIFRIVAWVEQSHESRDQRCRYHSGRCNIAARG